MEEYLPPIGGASSANYKLGSNLGSSIRKRGKKKGSLKDIKRSQSVHTGAFRKKGGGKRMSQAGNGTLVLSSLSLSLSLLCARV